MAIMYYNSFMECKQKANENKENRASVVAVDLYRAGIIKDTTIRTLANRDSIKKAVIHYVMRELASQKEKGSTATIGKTADSWNRAKKAIARGLSVDLVDIPCRPAGQYDIMVGCDDEAAEMLGKSSTAVEIKTGGGTLINGATRDECWDILAEACKAQKWVAWYFDVRGFDPFAEKAWDKFDELPCIFLNADELLYRLKEYGKDVETWFKFNGDTALNFQTVINSEKKTTFLYHILDDYSYDWPTFRDTGRLVKLADN